MGDCSSKPKAESAGGTRGGDAPQPQQGEARERQATTLEPGVHDPNRGFFLHEDPRIKYDWSEELGEGSFGQVMLAKHKVTGVARAIKLVDKAKLETDKDSESLEDECEILLKFGVHENICRLYEVYSTSTEIAMVMELVKGGDLFDGIVNAPDHKLSQLAATVLSRSCSAFSYLAKNDVAHRDIKPENIMLVRACSRARGAGQRMPLLS
jgi:serine/threonine protein kinase